MDAFFSICKIVLILMFNDLIQNKFDRLSGINLRSRERKWCVDHDDIDFEIIDEYDDGVYFDIINDDDDILDDNDSKS